MQRGQDESQSWTQELNQEPLAEGPTEDDFSKFLELGNDFSQFETIDQQHGPSGLDTPMGRLTFAQDGQMHILTPQQQAMLHNMELSMSGMPSGMDFSQSHQSSQGAGGSQYQQYATYQQMQNPYQHQVPPTPVSTEMHAAKFAAAMDSAGQIIFDRQNASFTPLVSPAQTPVENPWGMPDYVVADDFFSPLTSPAIEAQQQQYTSTNATSSPVDLSSEKPNAARKPRRKLNPTSRVTSSRSLKGSPATKPINRRRQASLSGQNVDRSGLEIERLKHLLPTASSSRAISSEDSVSPEPLSESLMRPPPVPQSRTPSALRPIPREINAPATPATLMRIPGKQSNVAANGGSSGEPPDIMEDIALPDAAADLPQRILPSLDVSITRDADESSTPTLSVKTPKLCADSTPRSSGPKSLDASSEIVPRPGRGGRTSKKRQSMSQATISPALRPKISPSISPLVPSNASGMPILSAETSALYLASKSNYQNIIDGTHLPGVSYPETLAENLSSKRTSHKIAEQGRRNRINLALKEIETLLPASITAAAARKEKASKDDNAETEKAGSGQGASKASTVEMAIVYIRSLQSELQATKSKLEALEKNLADASSNGSQTSGEAT